MKQWAGFCWIISARFLLTKTCRQIRRFGSRAGVGSQRSSKDFPSRVEGTVFNLLVLIVVVVDKASVYLVVLLITRTFTLESLVAVSAVFVRFPLI